MLVVVDADRQARMARKAALIRRFEPDYRVMTADSPSTSEGSCVIAVLVVLGLAGFAVVG